MKHVRAIGVIGAAVFLAGCSAADEAAVPESSQSRPGTTPTSTGEAKLPKITFDPCQAIDDTLVLQFGLDPDTRTREERTIGTREVNACHFHTDDRGLVIIAQNRPWSELPSALSVTPEAVTVNGREALFAIGGVGTDSCEIDMRTSFGAVIVDSAPFRGGDADPNMHACDGIWDIAQAIEPLIDDGT